MPVTTVPDVRAKDLLAVVALAEYGSFVAAAAFLKISQPALTRTIKHVERAVGVTLFARSTRRVEITPAGREFVSVAERVLDDLQITTRNMREVASEQRGQVIVSTYSAFAYHPLPSILGPYQETRPQIVVNIREGRQPDIIEDVRSGVADLGIGYVDMIPDTLQSVTLRREPLYVVCPDSHPVARQRLTKVRFTDLRDEHFVSLPPDSYTRRLVDGTAAACGFSIRHRLTVMRFESVVRYVRSGAGLGIIPAGAVPQKPWRDLHAAVLTAPSLTVTVGLMTLKGRYLTPPASSLMTLIQQYFLKSRPASGPQAVRGRTA